jgi:hypothetical protein
MAEQKREGQRQEVAVGERKKRMRNRVSVRKDFVRQWMLRWNDEPSSRRRTLQKEEARLRREEWERERALREKAQAERQLKAEQKAAERERILDEERKARED